MILQNKRRCSECGWLGDTDEVMTAPNPFDAYDTTDIIEGCPRCHQVETMEVICDEPGCKNVTSCGTPTIHGYRHTCYEHDPTRLEDRMEC